MLALLSSVLAGLAWATTPGDAALPWRNSTVLAGSRGLLTDSSAQCADATATLCSASAKGTLKNLVQASPSSCTVIVTLKAGSTGKQWDCACSCASEESTQCQAADDQCHTYVCTDGTWLFEVED
jgi:hypothetical protein